MSRLLVMAVIIVGVAAAGVTAWTLVSSSTQSETVVAPAEATADSGAARRDQRERFFGGDTDRNIRGGQEKRPRW